MAEALRNLPQSEHENLLVGYNKADDAGVFRISDNLALVQTVDFFPPIVDDPYHFGQIAAANALSDVYAMGGRPVTALNIVAFPSADLPKEILSEILRGGYEKIEEAGAVIVGGHSIKDKELKYGLSVTGLIDPNRIVTNAGAQTGDILFLTKPLGTGIITTGIKRRAVDSTLEDVVIRQMAQLNRDAAEIMLRHGVSAATDITGFGLLGHANEMAAASECTLRIEADKLPVMARARSLAREGMIPGGAKSNREFLVGKVSISDKIDSDLIDIMYDPQTSGGLLIAIPAENSGTFAQEMADRKGLGQEIGRVESRSTHSLVVE